MLLVYRGPMVLVLLERRSISTWWEERINLGVDLGLLGQKVLESLFVVKAGVGPWIQRHVGNGL
jgi:hypothetical protein